MKLKGKLKVGSRVRIKSQPGFYSTNAGGSDGTYKVSYPYYFTVQAIKESANHIALYDGVFGWSYSAETENLFELLDQEENSSLEIIEGEYYYAEWDSSTCGKLKSAIYKHALDNAGPRILIHSKDFGYAISFRTDIIKRLATSEEKRWLDACIEADKFVTKEKALSSTPKLEVGKWWETLKKGDVVRCIANKLDLNSRTVGHMYTILKDFDPINYPYIDFSPSERSRLYHEFELVRRKTRLATKELVVGKTYTARFSGGNVSCLFRQGYKSIDFRSGVIEECSTKFYPSNTDYTAGGLEESTEDEVAWFEACVAQNKLIPRDEISQQKDIIEYYECIKDVAKSG